MIFKRRNNELYVFESAEEFNTMTDYVPTFNPNAFRDIKDSEIVINRWNKKYKKFVKEKMKIPLPK